MSNDPRLADCIVTVGGEGTPLLGDVIIVGFPWDEGVRRNGGRVGAAGGPQSFRKYVRRICATDAQHSVDLRTLKLLDSGDINANDDDVLEDGHRRLTERVYSIIQKSDRIHWQIPFVMGGGNDQSWPNGSALLRLAAEQCRPVLIVNIDAHLDVRPLIPDQSGQLLAHSGSPFRQLVMDKRFRDPCRGQLVEFGCQGPQCSLEHAQFVRDNGGRLMWYHEMVGDCGRRFAQVLAEADQDSLIFISFDLDAVRASDAPGVSCSSPTGLSAQEALDICRLAGRDRRVSLFDLSEYNPTVDEYRTGRLVAMMFHAFCVGVKLRDRHA